MTKDSIIQKLKERGLRITPQRLAVIDVLVENGHLHPGAGFIYKEAKKKSRSLSLSTTCESNLDEHINLICERCGKIIDYKAPISLDQRGVAKKTGFIVTNSRLEYYGYCRDCSKDKGRSIADRKPHNRYS
jgi:Fur family peroxide stress response transcriptional regulator